MTHNKNANMAMKALIERVERKNKILKWLPSFLEEEFKDQYWKMGHTSFNHMNRDDEFLIRRCVREGKDASSFYGNEMEISDLVYDLIVSETEKIARFLANLETKEDDALVLECAFPKGTKVTGYVYHNLGGKKVSGKCKCKYYRVCLKKTKTMREVYLASAYPVSENTEEE